MKNLLDHLRVSVIATVVLAILVCGIYPLIVWAVGQAAFHDKANGSLIVRNRKVIGSRLLAQGFTQAKYFHPRPSAAGNGYDPTATGGTNLGPTSEKLISGIHKKTPDGKDDPANFDGVRDLVIAYRQENGLSQDTPVPADAVTRSGSGLDPHISVRNAMFQVPRVAKARGVDEHVVHRLIHQNTEREDLGILGEARVNVLMLNLALDDLQSARP